MADSRSLGNGFQRQLGENYRSNSMNQRRLTTLGRLSRLKKRRPEGRRYQHTVSYQLNHWRREVSNSILVSRYIGILPHTINIAIGKYYIRSCRN